VEDRGEAAPAGVGEHVRPFGQREGVLDHEGVDQAEAALEDVQAQHPELLHLAAVGGELAALAEADVVVDAVVVLHHVEAGLGLALQVAVAEPAGQEDGALGAAGLEHRGVGGVGGLGGEPAQQRLGGGGAQPDRGRVLHHQVVVVLDDVPAHWPGQRRGEHGVGVLAAAAPWESTKFCSISMLVPCRIAPSIIAWTSEAEQLISWLCTAIDPAVSTVQ
jgi:hypothetical protein